tara:strand:+ start:303 stop:494 length:192 start_codon:yes stop_codon:yes gene_type:complete
MGLVKLIVIITIIAFVWYGIKRMVGGMKRKLSPFAMLSFAERDEEEAYLPRKGTHSFLGTITS